MIKPEFLEKNQLIMREIIATGTNEENDKEITICRSLNGMSIIVEYNGQKAVWSVKDMVEASVNLIDKLECE